MGILKDRLHVRYKGHDVEIRTSADFSGTNGYQTGFLVTSLFVDGALQDEARCSLGTYELSARVGRPHALEKWTFKVKVGLFGTAYFFVDGDRDVRVPHD